MSNDEISKVKLEKYEVVFSRWSKLKISMAILDQAETDIMMLLQHWRAIMKQSILQGVELQSLYQFCQKRQLVAALGFKPLFENVEAFDQVKGVGINI